MDGRVVDVGRSLTGSRVYAMYAEEHNRIMTRVVMTGRVMKRRVMEKDKAVVAGGGVVRARSVERRRGIRGAGTSAPSLRPSQAWSSSRYV